jgi:glutamine synthetase adenylyltransferase
VQKLGAAGMLAAEDAKTLVEAAALQQALTQALRIALDGTLDPQTATPGLKGLLVRAAGAEDFSELEARLAETQSAVRVIYERVLS